MMHGACHYLPFKTTATVTVTLRVIYHVRANPIPTKVQQSLAFSRLCGSWHPEAGRPPDLLWGEGPPKTYGSSFPHGIQMIATAETKQTGNNGNGSMLHMSMRASSHPREVRGNFRNYITSILVIRIVLPNTIAAESQTRWTHHVPRSYGSTRR